MRTYSLDTQISFQTAEVAQTIDHSDIVAVTTEVYSIAWGIVVGLDGSAVTVSFFNETTADWQTIEVDASEVELIIKGDEFFADIDSFYGSL